MEKNLIQQEEMNNSNENIIDNNSENKKKFFSEMNEEETNIWLKKLNLDENVLTEFGNIVKNAKDLISIYNNPKMIEKLNLDLHSNNMINTAIEEAMEEQLKINIEIEQGKNIILNIENEPKYELKEIYNYLELLLKKKVFLCPKNNPTEILIPNTLIYKKILLNPNKYCFLSIFNDNMFDSNVETKNNNDININLKQTPDLNLEKKEKEINKGYNSLFQMKKKNPISDFTTEYQMPNYNKTNDINNNINNTDFKYQNILSNKNKDKDNINNNKFNLNSDNNNININNEQKKLIPSFNIINNVDTNINKNYLTQRNFNPKYFPKSEINNNNNDNGEIFSKITNFKIIDRTKNINNNSNVEREKNLDNINMNPKNKTENRYEFVKYQELDIFKNKNLFNNSPQPELNNNDTNKEVNDINNLILKTQTPNIPSMKNTKKEDSDDILKSLREKYSLQNNNNGRSDMKEISTDYNKDYKPKTPIAEGRRTFNNDNTKLNFLEENSNEPLENKFMNLNNNRQNKKEDFDKYSFLNKNKDNMFNINNNEINEQNNGFGNLGKIRANRPSPGLDFNNFQYKASGYKSSFGNAPDTKNTAVPVSFTKKKVSEGFRTSAKVQYVAKAGTYLGKDLPYTGALRVLKVIMGYDYLWNQVRVVGGAYGCFSAFTKGGKVAFSSYRDPNLSRTLEVYDNAVQYIDEFDAGERDMTKYIIGTVSDLDFPLTPSAKGARSREAILTGDCIENVQRERDEILGCTSADIRGLRKYIEKARADECICVLGAEEEIEKEKSRFTVTQPLFRAD